MGSHVMIVSLPGFDAEKATPEQCAIHTKYNSPKIDSTKDNFINLSIFFASEPPDASPGSTKETIIYSAPHSYKYMPQIWLHCDYEATVGGSVVNQFGPGEAFLAAAGVGDLAYLGVRADKSSYYVYVRKHYTAAPVVVLGIRANLRIYIFAETAIE